MWRCLYPIKGLWVLSRIVHGKTVVVARAWISQTGLVQNAVDPNPGTLREDPTKVTNTTGSDCGPERVQQPRPLLTGIGVTLRLIGSKCRGPRGGWV
jgi:hypothetical protein